MSKNRIIISISMPPDLKKRLKQMAKMNGIGVSQYVCEIIEKQIEEETK